MYKGYITTGKVINGEQIIYERLDTGINLWNKNNVVEEAYIVQYNYKTTHYNTPIKIMRFTFFKIRHMQEYGRAVALFKVSKNYNMRVHPRNRGNREGLEIDKEMLIKHFEGKPKPYWYEKKLEYLDNLIKEIPL